MYRLKMASCYNQLCESKLDANSFAFNPNLFNASCLR